MARWINKRKWSLWLCCQFSIHEYKVSGPLFSDSVATSPDQPLIIPNFTVLPLRPHPSAMRTCVAAAIVQGLVLNAAASGPTVDIDAGTLQGGLCTNNPHAAYFKSIPYAQPPVGDLRFAPPQPCTQRYKSGARNSTTPSPTCIQFDSEFAVNENNSEDW